MRFKMLPVPVCRMLHSSILLLCGSLLLSCSTAPDPPKASTEKKNRAAEYTVAGNSYFNEGRYTQALQFFNLALNDNISVDNEPGIIRSYNSIGKVYLAAGYLDEAEQNFRKAVQRAEALQDPHLLAHSKTNLAELSLERQQVEQATALLEEAMSSVDGLDEKDSARDLAIIYHNVGTVQKKRGMLDQADAYFRKALAINLELEQYEEIASNYYMIASIHSKRGEYPAARESIDLALSYDKRVENSLGIAKDLFARGMIEQKAGDDRAAFQSFEKSFEVYRAMYQYSSAAAVLPHLIALAERLGENEEARRFRQLQQQLEE